MPEFSFVLLYVEDPPASAEFYSRLLGHAPLETAPTFAMLPLRDGVMLGLWSRATVRTGRRLQGGRQRSRVHSRRRQGSRCDPRRLD